MTGVMSKVENESRLCLARRTCRLGEPRLGVVRRWQPAQRFPPEEVNHLCPALWLRNTSEEVIMSVGRGKKLVPLPCS
jgi:hypothetical protein